MYSQDDVKYDLKTESLKNSNLNLYLFTSSTETSCPGKWGIGDKTEV